MKARSLALSCAFILNHPIEHNESLARSTEFIVTSGGRVRALHKGPGASQSLPEWLKQNNRNT